MLRQTYKYFCLYSDDTRRAVLHNRQNTLQFYRVHECLFHIFLSQKDRYVSFRFSPSPNRQRNTYQSDNIKRVCDHIVHAICMPVHICSLRIDVQLLRLSTERICIGFTYYLKKRILDE